MTHRLLTEPAKVLVGVCSDDFYPFDEFLHSLGLQEGDYFPIEVPGGLAPLAHKEILPVFFNAIKGYMSVAMEHRPIDTLIVFAHVRCGFYADFLPDLFGKEEEDLPTIVEVSHSLFPKRFNQVQIYHAIPDGGIVRFNPKEPQPIAA